MFRGAADVVVCDGFVGNVALAASEGIVKLMAQMLREEFSRTPLTKAVAALYPPPSASRRMDPSQHNGAAVGQKSGIVIKSHGGTDAFGFSNAIERARRNRRTT